MKFASRHRQELQGRMGASVRKSIWRLPAVAASAANGRIWAGSSRSMTGRVRYWDDVNTDVLAPGTYIKLPPEGLPCVLRSGLTWICHVCSAW